MCLFRFGICFYFIGVGFGNFKFGACLLVFLVSACWRVAVDTLVRNMERNYSKDIQSTYRQEWNSAEQNRTEQNRTKQQINKWIDGWMDEWMDGWMDG